MDKETFKKCLELDNEGWGYHSWWYRFARKILGSESYYKNESVRLMRYVEYYSDKGGLSRLLYLYYKLRYNRMRCKSNIYVAPFTFGPGLFIPHPCFVRADSFVLGGANIRILPNVLFGLRGGNPKGLKKEDKIEIGDNVMICAGSIILKPVKIGNNAIIGAGSVVTHDVPENAIVAGAPARVISYRKDL